MALTKVTTGGITDATVATADIAADAITGAKIADDAVGAEHIEQLDANLSFADSVAASFGAGADLLVQHDGTNNYIGTQNGNILLTKVSGTEKMVQAIPDGSVELYHDNLKRLETVGYGADIYGQTNSSQLRLRTSDGTNRAMFWANGNDVYLTDAQDHSLFKGIKDGAVELYHDNSKKLETTSTGVAVTGNISGSMASNFTLVDVDRVDTSSQHTISGVNSWNTDSGFGSRTISNYQQGQLIIIRATVPCGIALQESSSTNSYGGTRVRLKLTNGSASTYTNERVAWYRADGAGTHETTQNLGITLIVTATDTTFSNGDTLTLTIEGKIMTGGAGSATHFIGGWNSTKEVCIERYAKQLA